jgi:predicted nucleic acid-binding protein
MSSVLVDTSVWVAHFRQRTLSDLGLLQATQQASLREVMAFVEREKLYGLGCGLVDISLLASTMLTPGATLWTLDKSLAELAERYKVAHKPPLH